MANLDEQVEAIRAALQSRTDKSTIWREDDYNSEKVYRALETKVSIRNKDASKRKQFDKANLELEIFRAEIAILLDENKGRLAIMPAQPQEGQDPAYFIDAMAQNEEYLYTEMMQLLQSEGIRVSRWAIRDTLRDVTKVVRAKIASGQQVGILDFVPKHVRKKLLGKQAIKAHEFLFQPVAHQPKKKKSKQPKLKRGKRRPVELLVNGKAQRFESMAEANRETGFGRGYIQYNANKERENQI